MATLTINPKPPVQATRSKPSELPQFFRRIAQCPGEFVVYDDGYRGWTFSYHDIARLAETFAARLRSEGLRKGDAVMIWSESRPGWLVALWGCLLEGAVVVPVDPQSSVAFFHRIEQRVHPRLVLLGERQPAMPGAWRLSEIEHACGAGDRFSSPASWVALSAEDVAEIVFTSGTTAEPKGVIITHGNLAANLKPLEDQLSPYVKYVRPFFPLRILNLLPMSHLFGQALATFLPPLIPASAVFISSGSAREIARQIRMRRVCILGSVPKVLEVLRDFVVHRFPEAADTSHADRPWPLRWWRYRAVHRMFGWKFCCLVAGGAPLAPDVERFWSNLGFVVVQGYGLTETAPIISFSHPFHVRHGTTGKPLVGVKVRIADDGEVLVRGPNVTPGYFLNPAETAAAFRDGWFHTGDLGTLDAEGHLIIRGRKKDLIVTPEGLNVFPEDVEAVLNTIPGVRDSAVTGPDRVHGVLVLEPGADAADIVRQANARLEEHQKIRAVSVWPGGELPRTSTTRKLRRAEIAATLRGGTRTSRSETDLRALVQKYAPGRSISDETSLEELGLSSLDRVQLMMDLEEKLGASIDEAAFASARTVADLARPMEAAEETPFPAYNRAWAARLVRRFSLGAILLPATRFFARAQVYGIENLNALRGPVIFAANHQSYLDTPVILANLPRRLRYGIAPAMWKEYFEAHFHPQGHAWPERWLNSLIYRLVTVLFNAFPVPQTEMGARESVRYMGELVEQGWSILIFPEGERSRTGEIGRFFPGVAMIASRLRLPVVPVRLNGVGRVLPPAVVWPHRGFVEVRFGAPIQLKGESYPALAGQVEDAIRAL